MVFKSDAQRKGFFASKGASRASTEPKFIKETAFSYRDGRNLGKFDNLQEVFKKFPSERKAFNRVITFRRKTGIQVNTIEEIKKRKRKMNINRRWDK